MWEWEIAPSRYGSPSEGQEPMDHPKSTDWLLGSLPQMQIEDEQEHFFFQSEQEEFFSQQLVQGQFESPSLEPFNYVQHFKNIDQKLEDAQIFEDWGFITEQQRKNFEKFNEHNKYMTGIQGMITLEGKEKMPNVLMNEEFQLGTFFDGAPIPTKELFEREVHQLSRIIGTVDNNLVENFENYTYIEKANGHRFLQKLRQSYHEQIAGLRKKKDKVELFTGIFSWWVQEFRDMIMEIEKCSPLYTLNVFKKEKEREKFEPVSMMVELTSSKDEEEEAKQRKLWSRHEIEMLSKVMDGNTTIPSNTIKEVATQLGRSFVAVQSKIQKLQKEKKNKPVNDLSLEKKMLIVLANFPFGLCKEQLLVKMESQFEMGDEDTWKKSVSQLLSVSKKVVKSKGVFSFTSVPPLQAPTNFKNKVIACLYELPNQRGNLKAITRKYVQKFSYLDGINPQDTERVKLIQGSIYKTIFKYDIFDKSSSKLLYKYVENEASNRDSQSDRSESGSKDYTF